MIQVKVCTLVEGYIRGLERHAPSFEQCVRLNIFTFFLLAYIL